MESRSECPVCKAGISVENVIPVYGRGAESADPRYVQCDVLPSQALAPNAHASLLENIRTQEMSENGVPSRPRGQRPDAEVLRRRRPRQVHFCFDDMT